MSDDYSDACSSSASFAPASGPAPFEHNERNAVAVVVGGQVVTRRPAADEYRAAAWRYGDILAGDAVDDNDGGSGSGGGGGGGDDYYNNARNGYGGSEVAPAGSLSHRKAADSDDDYDVSHSQKRRVAAAIVRWGLWYTPLALVVLLQVITVVALVGFLVALVVAFVAAEDTMRKWTGAEKQAGRVGIPTMPFYYGIILGPLCVYDLFFITLELLISAIAVLICITPSRRFRILLIGCYITAKLFSGVQLFLFGLIISIVTWLLSGLWNLPFKDFFGVAIAALACALTYEATVILCFLLCLVLFVGLTVALRCHVRLWP